MAIDQPIVVYDHSKSKGSRKKGEKREFKKANPLDVLDAQRKWDEKYAGKEGQPIKFDFSGFNVNNTSGETKKQ